MSFPAPRHNHRHCIQKAMNTAEEKSKACGLRLTEIRRRVLEILWQSHIPLGAYEILDLLPDDGRRPAPMVVYRALDFLMEAGLAHKLSSKNAFIGCSDPSHDHEAQFLICDECGTAAEVEAKPIAKALEATAASAGFQVHQHVVEISGICPNCLPQT